LRLAAHFAELASFSRAIILNLLLIVVTLLVGWMIYRDSQTRVVIVNPVHLPDALLKSGYSPEIVGSHIAAHLKAISATARTAMQREVLQSPGAQVDIQLPAVGISYRSVVRLVKQILGFPDIVVTSDLIQSGNQLEMRIVVDQANVANEALLVRGDIQEFDALLMESAKAIQKLVKPYVLASYYHSLSEQRCTRTSACDFSSAIAIYKEILAGGRRDEHKWALVGWSAALIGMGKYDLASEKAFQAIKIAPRFSLAYEALGNALSNLDHNKDASDAYQRAAELSPKDSEPFIGWGHSLRALGRNEAAIEKYRRAAELDPKKAFTFVSWGNALRSLGHHDEAIEKYHHAKELDPNYTSPLIEIGYTLRSLDRNAEAIEAFRHAARLDPNSALALIGEGEALGSLGQHVEAMQAYSLAAERDPHSASAFVGWARALDKLGRRKDALEKYERAANLDPKNSLYLIWWGDALASLGRKTGALDKYHRATEINPQDAHSFQKWALALYDLGQRSSADDKLRRAIALGLKGQDLNQACLALRNSAGKLPAQCH